MSKFKQSDGFTLIELMIVVAIIAIIAAIAIPSILRSRISANETSAQGSLDSVVKSNQLFRQNDSDSNGINDYWSEDIYGLWGIISPGGDRLELVGSSMAGADYSYSGSAPTYTSPSVWGTTPTAQPSAKSGYFFGMLTGEMNSGNTGGGPDSCDVSYDSSTADPDRDPSKFAAVGFPSSYDSTGRKAYLVTNGGETYTIDAKESSNGMQNAFNGSNSGSSDDPNSSEGTMPVGCVPNQKQLSNNWSSK